MTNEPNVHKGDKLRFVRDIEIIALVSWLAPTTSGHEIIVPAGTSATVACDSIPIALGLSCVPSNYDEFGEQFIPEHRNRVEGYSGYHLVVMKSEIGKGVVVDT